MTSCTNCGRELEPSRAAKVSTCPQCESAAFPARAAQPLVPASATSPLPDAQGAPAPPASAAEPHTAGPVLTTHDRVPLTGVLVAINVILFVLMVAKGASLTQPATDQLLRWGANFGPLTLMGQWWRLLTAMFVHIGIVHLVINMWVLWNMGLLAEELYGRRTFMALYLLSGLAASLVSVAGKPLVVTAGASGAIFGLAGALIATLYLARLSAPRSALRITFVSLVVFAVYTVTYGIIKGGIDNRAHVGGLVSGLLLGAVLTADFQPMGARLARIRSVVFPLFAMVLLVAAVVVRYVHAPLVRVEFAEQQLRNGDTAGALRALNDVIQARPNFAPAWLLLGGTYLRLQQQAKAEAAYQRAAQLNPKDSAALAQLGVLYLRDRRYEQARQAFQRITELNPNDGEAHVNLGVTLNLMGRGDEALASFRRATQLRPKLVLAWYNFGILSMNSKHYDDAVDAFTQTTKLAPKDAEAWIWLANAYQAKGMTEQADAAYLTGYKLRSQARRPPPRRKSD